MGGDAMILRQVVIGFALLACTLLALSLVAVGPFEEARVGNAGEWFAGLATVAVLAWAVDEPARHQRQIQRQTAAAEERRLAWNRIYDETCRLPDPDLSDEKKVRQELCAPTGSKVRAAWHQDIAERLESAVAARIDWLGRLEPHLVEISIAVEALAESDDATMDMPAKVLRRLAIFVGEHKHLDQHDTDALRSALGTEETQDAVGKVRDAAIEAFLALREVAGRRRAFLEVPGVTPLPPEAGVLLSFVHLDDLLDGAAVPSA